MLITTLPAKSRNVSYVWTNISFTLFLFNCLWSSSMLCDYLTQKAITGVLLHSFILLLICSILMGVLLGCLIGLLIPPDQQEPEASTLLHKHKAYGSTLTESPA